MSKIKKNDSQKHKIKTPTPNNIELDYPVFCFKHLQITKTKTDFKFYSDFIERLTKLCSLSWNDINTSHRHGFGTEKIPVDKIKPDLPKFVTPEVTDLTVFRATGDNRPFLGLRKNSVFHIIFIEENFNDIYDHGSK